MPISAPSIGSVVPVLYFSGFLRATESSSRNSLSPIPWTFLSPTETGSEFRWISPRESSFPRKKSLLGLWYVQAVGFASSYLLLVPPIISTSLSGLRWLGLSIRYSAAKSGFLGRVPIEFLAAVLSNHVASFGPIKTWGLQFGFGALGSIVKPRPIIGLFEFFSQKRTIQAAHQSEIIYWFPVH